MTLFESLTYAEFDAPLDTIDGVAAFILDEENHGLVFLALRGEIDRQARQPSHFKCGGYSWQPTIVAIVRGLPEARALFLGKPRSYDQICTACRILDRAAFILRGAA